MNNDRLTTLIGTAFAATTYGRVNGFALPETTQDWGAFLVAVLIFVFSYFTNKADYPKPPKVIVQPDPSPGSPIN